MRIDISIIVVQDDGTRCSSQVLEETWGRNVSINTDELRDRKGKSDETLRRRAVKRVGEDLTKLIGHRR